MKLSLVILSFCGVLAAQTPPPAAPPAAAAADSDPNAVVIKIGDYKLTAGQFMTLVRALPQQYQEIARTTGRREFANNLVEIHALSTEAAKNNLDKQPDTKLQIDFQRDNLLAQAMFISLQQAAEVKDSDVQAYYDAHKGEYETLTGRHILIRMKGSPVPPTPGKPELSEDEAKAKAESIRKRLAAGEDFAKIAKEESDDTSSGEKGGDLGEFGKGMMVPPFEQAAFALKVGEVSAPVESPFGFHVIQIQSHNTKSLADMKPQILAQLKPDAAHAAVTALVDKSKVELNDAFFGPESKPAPIPAIAK